MKTHFAMRAFFAGALAVVSTVSVPALGFDSALAHSAPCPYCAVTLSDDTASVLKMGRKRIEYKCVYCALAEAKTEYPSGDLTIHSPSEKKGQPVVSRRLNGQWSVLPATAAFVSPKKLKHKVCQMQSRAFTTKTAAQAYAKSNGGEVVTLAQLNAIVE